MTWEIKQGHVMEKLREIPEKSIQCVITSPPYWGLRAYGTDPQVWGGEKDCEHVWHIILRERQTGGDGTASSKQVSNSGSQLAKTPWEQSTCTKCGAWKGELGSEPNPYMFVEHMVEVFRAVKRVLRDDGVCFINITDSYSGSGKGPTGKSGVGNHETRQGFVGGQSKLFDYDMHDDDKDATITKSDVLDAWAAGFFDGEGHIQVNAHVNKTGELRLIVGQVVKEPLDLLQKLYGGNIHYQVTKSDRWANIWRWQLQSRKAVEALRRMLPYMTVKNEQAKLAIQFQETMGGSVKPRLTPAVIEERKRLATAIKELTKTGPKLDNEGMDIPSKNLCLIPERLLVALQQDGWIVRSKIRLIKVSAMPESINDRPSNATEELFMLTKSPRYFYDADAVRQAHVDDKVIGGKYIGNAINREDWSASEKDGLARPTFRMRDREYNPQGANLKNWWVWTPEHNDVEFCTGCNGYFEGALDKRRIRRKKVGDKIVSVCPDCGADDKWLAHYACVDDQTECLTIDGWKRYDEISIDDTIASYNIGEQLLRWTPIQNIFKYDVVDESLIHAKSRSLDMMMTPNHRCLIKRHIRSKNKHYISDPVITYATDIDTSDYILTAASWENGGEEVNPVWAELLGWYIAEGCALKNSNTVEISQSLSANAPKVERLRELLDLVEANYVEATGNRTWRGREANQTYFHIKGYTAAKLREMAPHKKLTTDVLGWSTTALRALMYGLIEGDGVTRKDDLRMSFIQKDKYTADLVQAIAIRIGWSAMMSRKDGIGIYTIYFTNHTTRTFRGTNGNGTNVSIENNKYTGVLWCPQTIDGTWVARRNGRVFITGNSFPTWLPRRCIEAGTSSYGACAKCGAPWQRVTEKTKGGTKGKSWHDHSHDDERGNSWTPHNPGVNYKTYKRGETLDWEPTCKCVCPDLVLCRVLDLFSGTGTTALVADRLGRHGIGVELNEGYYQYSLKRLSSDAPLVAAIEEAEKAIQIGLFEEVF
jgi:hypothetical protein